MSLINDALKKANQAQKKRAPQGPLGAPLQPVDSLKRPPSHMPMVAVALLTLVLGGASVWIFMGWKANNNPALAQAETAGSPIAAGASGTGERAPVVDSASTSVIVEPATESPPETTSPSISSSPSAVRAPIDTGASAVAAETASLPDVQRDGMAALKMPEPLKKPMTDNAIVGTDAPTIARPSASLGSSTPSGVGPSATPMASTASGPGAPAVSPPLVAAVPAVPAASSASVARNTEIEFPNLQLQGIFFRLKNPSVMINSRSLFVGDKIAGVRIADIQRRTVTIEKDGQQKTLSMSGL